MSMRMIKVIKTVCSAKITRGKNQFVQHQQRNHQRHLNFYFLSFGLSHQGYYMLHMIKIPLVHNSELKFEVAHSKDSAC